VSAERPNPDDTRKQNAAKKSAPNKGNAGRLLTRLAKLRESRRKHKEERSEEEKQSAVVMVVLFGLSVPALLALCIYAASSDIDALGLGLLTAAGSFCAGALVGFLFGIPRTAAQQAAEGGDGSSEHAYTPNTNLEQISDWLTKILVGAGLVQIGNIGGAIDDLAGGLEAGLGDYGHAAAVLLLVSFSIIGFLSSYLFARLNLQTAFEPFKKALEEQEESLTSALPMVRAQLDPSGDRDPTVPELVGALYESSSGIRDEAFYLARYQRRTNWRGGERRLVALVIPVFEALVELDEKKEYHRNYAELAYALKDQANPRAEDYERARALLSEAIKIRGGRAWRFPMYELNRAFCNIVLEPEAMAKQISEDLTQAAETAVGLDAIAGSDEIRKWLADHPQVHGVPELIAKIPAEAKKGEGERASR
jgi:tetratricopeptide (TPR) repeat protein